MLQIKALKIHGHNNHSEYQY